MPRELLKLNDSQTKFIERFIANKNFVQKEIIKIDFLKYERRKNKVHKELFELPIHSADRQRLQESLDKAMKKAEQGEFSQAYHDLKNVKITARAKANGHEEALGLAMLHSQIKDLKKELVEVHNIMKHIDSEMNDAFAAIPENALEEEYLESVATALRMRVETLDESRGKILQCLDAKPEDRIQDFIVKKELLAKNGARSAALETDLQELIDSGWHEKTQLVTKDVEARFEEQKTKFYSEFDFRLYPSKQDAKKSEERFKKFQEQYQADKAKDNPLNTETKNPKRKVDALRTFNTVEFVNIVSQPVRKKIDDKKISAYCTKAEQQLAKLINNEPANSDVVFDLMLKNEKGLQEELSQGLGLNYSDCTADQKKLIDNLSVAMTKTIRDRCPNKMSKEKTTLPKLNPMTGRMVNYTIGKEISLNGAQYSKPKILAAGGMGVAVRYEDNNVPGEYVVVKKALKLNNEDFTTREEARNDIIDEMKAHRFAMGGEKGKGHANVVEMKGILLDDDGLPYSVMEFAGGGELKDASTCLHQTAENGLVSPAARQALIQNMFSQAVEGMKFVAEQNMTHNDIKSANIFLDKDGNVKVADFGSGVIGKNADGEMFPVNTGGAVPMTRAYAAPELSPKNKISSKADTYSLGTMLAEMTGEKHGVDNLGQRGALDWTKNPQNGEKIKPISALDKLKLAMLDPDPEKRPTLEAVSMSVYLNASENDHDPQDIDNLKKAFVEYSNQTGGAIAKQHEIVLESEVVIGDLEKSKSDPNANTNAIDAKIQRERNKIEDAKERIKVINEAPENRPLVEALEKASAKFEGYAEPASKLKSDFAGKYTTIKDSIKKWEDSIEIDNLPKTDLVKLLKSIDNQDEIKFKRLFASHALKYVEQYMKVVGKAAMNAVAKKAPSAGELTMIVRELSNLRTELQSV